jgi:Skp family chaperone for outer membrane proteins
MIWRNHCLIEVVSSTGGKWGAEMFAASRVSLVCVFWLVLFHAPVFAQWWNPFAPADYEDCIESAAKAAKSKAALEILVSACEGKFTGRRSPGGGYSYFDARQGKQFNIIGPNPTAAELKRFDEEYSRYLAEQRQLERIAAEQQPEQEAAENRRQQARIDWELRKQEFAADLQKRQENATSKIKITSTKIECSYCRSFDLTIALKNQSGETISRVSVGWTFIPPDQTNCPTSFETKSWQNISLRPKDTAVLNIHGRDGPAENNTYKICTGVTGVEIASQ